LGAGGKTNVGYGYFETPKAEIQKVEEGKPETVTTPEPAIGIIERLLNHAKQCRGPGDKAKLVKVFEDARVLPYDERLELYRKVEEVLPDIVKKNKKIKRFLKEKRDELKIQFTKATY